MQEFLDTFGFDWPKLFAQVIIFMIVFWVLKKKAFGPILGMLEERRSRIADGEAKLKEIEDNSAKAAESAQAVLDKANKDAERLIEEARESATAIAEKKTQEATNEASSIIAKAREASELERDQAMSLLKKEFGRLVVDTTSRVTGKVLTKDDQQAINQETAGQIAL